MKVGRNRTRQFQVHLFFYSLQKWIANRVNCFADLVFFFNLKSHRLNGFDFNDLVGMHQVLKHLEWHSFSIHMLNLDLEDEENKKWKSCWLQSSINSIKTLRRLELTVWELWTLKNMIQYDFSYWFHWMWTSIIIASSISIQIPIDRTFVH